MLGICHACESERSTILPTRAELWTESCSQTEMKPPAHLKSDRSTHKKCLVQGAKRTSELERNDKHGNDTPR